MKTYEAPCLIAINDTVHGGACNTGSGNDCFYGCEPGNDPKFNFHGRILELGCATGTLANGTQGCNSGNTVSP